MTPTFGIDLQHESSHVESLARGAWFLSPSVCCSTINYRCFMCFLIISTHMPDMYRFIYIYIYVCIYTLICVDIFIVELRTPAMPVGIGGGKERGGCHLNLRTWHAEGRWPILGLCWPSLGLCWPILRLCWPTPMRTKCCKLQHFALWDGKNPCKYHSLSPRKWLKHSYWQSLVHITSVDFLKNV